MEKNDGLGVKNDGKEEGAYLIIKNRKKPDKRPPHGWNIFTS